MRMWMVDPKLLCRPHLLGEHKELHMVVGSLNNHRDGSIIGLIRSGFLELTSLRVRHDRIVEEMIARNWNHRTPIGVFRYPSISDFGIVDIERSISDLLSRCEACSRLIYQSRKARL